MANYELPTISEAALSEHKWNVIWFGFHVQEECTRCGALRDSMYKSGQTIGSVPDRCLPLAK